jgi:dTDP-4-dehydrorhamnose reductase
VSPIRALVIGASGQLGGALQRARWPEGVAPRFLSRVEADLSQPDSLSAVVAAAAPDVVVNAAAYNAVDRAECEPALAFAVNAAGPEALAKAARSIGAALIHVSTDFVFDGAGGAPYDEEALVAPLSVYGRSKEEGERRVRAANPRHLVLRTAWLFGASGQNFVTRLMVRAADPTPLTMVEDQFGSPTLVDDLAAIIVALAPRMGDPGFPFGLYHAAGSVGASRLQQAETVFEALRAAGRNPPPLLGASAATLSAPAERPRDSRLDSGRLFAAFGIAPGDGLAATRDVATALARGTA